MLKSRKILILIIAAVVFAAAGVFLYLALKPKNTASDKGGIDGLLAPADSESRVVYPTDPVTITYWRTWNETAAMGPIIDAYRKLHPNVTIELRNIDYGVYDGELTRAAQAGQLPDIFSVLNDWIPRYIDQSKPAPDTVYASSKVYKDLFVDVVSNRLVNGDKINGVAFGASTLGLYYNPALLKAADVKVPETWDDVVAASKKLTKKNGTAIEQSGIALGTSFVHQSTDIETVLMMQNGAQMTDNPPTKALFAQPDAAGVAVGAKALDFYTSFANPAKQNYSFNDTLGYSIKAFADGKVAMMINYPFKALEVKEFNSGLDFKMTKLPQIKNVKPINYALYWAEMVNKTSPRSEVAWDFLRFAASKDQQKAFNKTTYRPSSRKDSVKDQQSDDVLGPFASQTDSAQTFYRANDKDMNGYFYDGTVSVLSGVDPQLSVKNMERRATDLIAKWPYK